MKKIFSVFLCVLLILSSLVFGVSADDAYAYDEEYYSKFKNDNLTLYVYNWGEYIADGSDDSMDVIEEFEALTGIRVEYTTFDTNEGLYSKLQSGSAYYDIIIPSDYMISRMAQSGMLEKLNYSNIPNFEKYVDETFRNPDYDVNQEYSVPYTWGTVGLIYNTKYVTEAVDSWDILWNENYSGKILMFSNSRDAFAIALKRLGYSMNTENPEELREAADLLTAQKDVVQAYVMDQIFDKMTEENAWIAPYYAGDYLTMSETNEDLAFVFPKEGFNQFVDAMCIPKGCVNKEAAEMFINFMCEPRVSAENCGYIGYSTPVSAAKDLMDEEMVSNEVAYPSAEVLENSETFRNLSDETNKLLDDLWIEVRIGKLTAGFWVTVALLAMGVCALCALSIYRKQKRLRARNAVK
ncbi:MAG: spermidine/putrescine ABC transporter substrate-binding protein [Clostridia bacterium]|nr:spermidine/putrescine ABC transporter substrate-binding protein [Clostridia bacterium]